MPGTPVVGVSAASFAKNPQLLTELAALPVQVYSNDTGRVLAGDELVAFFRSGQADCALVGTELVDQALLDACSRLRYVAKYGVGLDNIDAGLLRARGIGLGWTGGVNRRSVTELVLAFAIGHCHNVVASINRMRSGRWVKHGGVQLTNLTFGIVGLGHVGSDLAAMLKPFGCSVLYTDIVDKSSVASPLGLQLVDYATLLATADVISFHVPKTPETTQMFDAAALAKVQRHALIINTSRGSIVDFAATCAAVAAGRLGGFAADVYAEEPYDASQWASTEHLYFTPHIGGNTWEAVLAMGRSAIEHIRQFVAP